jgi:ABC-type Fe3+-hydroxamate transport system substrate-binding protein
VISLTDQTGFELKLEAPAQRIVSVVPSQTELLYHLGLGDRVQGRTRFCIYPEAASAATDVGGTKKLNLDLIASGSPDLILANKEENGQADIESLRDQFPVYTSDIKTLVDAKNMIQDVDKMTGTKEACGALIKEIDDAFMDMDIQKSFKVGYLIWQNPYMAAGSDTFIDHILELCGWENACRGGDRYPEVSIEKLKELDLDLLLLSTEPFPFDETHQAVLQERLPNVRVLVVDGTYFSWYGSRLVDAAAYLNGLLYGLNQS